MNAHEGTAAPGAIGRAALVRVGEEVRRRRGDLGLDQQELAEDAGVDPKTLRSLERGERWPRAGSRTKIERALGWPNGALDLLRRGEAPDSRDADSRFEVAFPSEASARVATTKDHSHDELEPLSSAELRLLADRQWVAERIVHLEPEDRERIKSFIDDLGRERFGDSWDTRFDSRIDVAVASRLLGVGVAVARLARHEVVWSPPTAEHEAALEARDTAQRTPRR